MFVRWKRYQRYRWGYDPTTHNFETVLIDEWTKSAAVVKSVRTPAGPRQEYVCYPGSIADGRERDESSYGAPRSFWRSAEENQREARVAGDALARVVAKLGAVVPLPDGFEPRWDEHWQWLPTDAEIDSWARVDAVLAVEAAREGDAESYSHSYGIEKALLDDKWYRDCYWQYATAEMDQAGLAGDDRARAEAALLAVVSRPTPEYVAYVARCRELGLVEDDGGDEDDDEDDDDRPTALEEAEWQAGRGDTPSPVVPTSGGAGTGLEYRGKLDAICAIHAERADDSVRFDDLGGVDEGKRSDERYRRAFWASAVAELAKIRINGDERARIEAVLAAAVPRPGG